MPIRLFVTVMSKPTLSRGRGKKVSRCIFTGKYHGGEEAMVCFGRRLSQKAADLKVGQRVSLVGKTQVIPEKYRVDNYPHQFVFTELEELPEKSSARECRPDVDYTPFLDGYSSDGNGNNWTSLEFYGW